MFAMWKLDVLKRVSIPLLKLVPELDIVGHGADISIQRSPSPTPLRPQLDSKYSQSMVLEKIAYL